VSKLPKLKSADAKSDPNAFAFPLFDLKPGRRQVLAGAPEGHDARLLVDAYAGPQHSHRKTLPPRSYDGKDPVQHYVDSVILHLMDGSNLGGPQITYPRSHLVQLFGTTAVAAKRLKRDYLGTEMLGEYVKMANQRIEEMEEDAPELTMSSE